MDDLLRDFVAETAENIDVVDRELVRFEQDPNNKAIVAQIFRLVHTIKGTCGFLGLPRLEALTHAAESAIDHFRDGAIVTSDLVTLILSTIDRIKLIMTELDRTMQEPEGEDQDLINELEAVTVKLSSSADVKPANPVLETDITTGELTYQVLERALRPGEVSLDELERVFRETSPEVVRASPASSQRKPTDALEKTVLHAQPDDHGVGQDGGSSQGPGNSQVRQHSIRVPIERLEHLMTMVSELVLTRNQLLEIARRHNDNRFKVPLQRLSQVTAELQDSVMQTRMQPIGTAWAMLPRLVRDLSQELNKAIEIETIGADTGIDRQLLEMIKDPMMHMVRNAADHGIEDAEVRARAGKPQKGKITIGAAQKGGYITLTIADDGRGLDLDRLKEKALDLGLATQAEIATMTDQQIVKFIFHAGFSTAQNLSNISGRGVGMDVVRSNIEQIGGSIDVNTVKGKGTSFEINIPLTLAIAAALIVECAGQRFALAQMTVLELVRAGSSNESRIEHLNQSPVLRLRERLLPLLQLSHVLGLQGAGLNEKQLDDANAEDWSKLFIVVCQVGQTRFGIVVDSVLQTEEIVVKPLSGAIANLSCYSGMTILGDGTVTMILEPNGLLQYLGANIEAHNDNSADQNLADAGNQKTTFLVFKAGTSGPKAIPLSLITRLEDIDVENIEWSSGQQLTQYRGRLMALKSAHDDLVVKSSGTQPVIVIADDSHAIGIMVDEIIDIVEDQLSISMESNIPGILGSAIIRDRSTEIMDVAHFAPHLNVSSGKRKQHKQDVLLIERNDMFSSMLMPVIQAAGFNVTTAATLDDAAKVIAHHHFDAVIANIEANKPASFHDIIAKARHVIGTASRASAYLLEEARDAGFSDVVGIFDREGLLASLGSNDALKGEAA
jgi:two-component system, chemotaxis family, sensor kinase CheA